jgi:acetylornithine deacetylase/succinyl-diaminopimelate desuccinylase-like protein
MNDILKFIDSNRSRYIEDLKELLRFPSISTNPENKTDVAACAEFLKNQFEKIGMQNVKIYPTGGHPVVYADWLDAGKDKPTVLIYGHYDVQPVDPLKLWTTPPFEPNIRGNNIYARGSADDKGQVLIHIEAIEAHLKIHNKLPLNIKMIVEGEEEIGSEHLDDFIIKHKDLLKADVVVISDTAMYDHEMPGIGYGCAICRWK